MLGRLRQFWRDLLAWKKANEAAHARAAPPSCCSSPPPGGSGR
ncbi:MAG: hypothetical protein PHR30_14845 [Gallionellaceae bacterium]|nr:hypothetical protein [Gallionellaceae bacterium]